MMMLGLAPIDTGDKVYSITPSSMSAGSVTAIDGFTLGPDSLAVQNATAFGATASILGRPGNYLGGSGWTGAMWETKGRGRDVVVTTWSRTGSVFLRADRTTGRAIQIRWTGQVSSGEMRVKYITNLGSTFEAVYNERNNYTGIDLFNTTDLSSYVTGWDTSDTSGDEFEFSLIANVLTVKWNSQTIFTTDILFWHMVPGHVMYLCDISEGAIRDTEIAFKASEATYTDGDARILDFRDWGWKQLTTTGSMSAGSTTLMVASATGFAIGDRIIVELGGEAGAGEPGTVGVGGTWPRDRYATAASLPDAATYYAANGSVDCYAWVQDEESVYINTGSAWGEWTNYARSTPELLRAYYGSTRLIPKALLATITNISGNTITLDIASDAATTNATVHYNNTWIFEYLMPNSRFTKASTNDISNDEWTVQFPSGTFCIAGTYVFPFGYNWTYKGTGRTTTILSVPKGAEVFQFGFSGEYPTVSDFKLVGWAGEKYFGTEFTTQYLENGNRHGVTVYGSFATGGTVERVDFVNCWGAVFMDSRFDAVCRDCTATHTNGNLQQYSSWHFVHSYSTNTWFEDLTYTGDKMGSAFEIFQADGGGFRRITVTNGIIVSNSSGGGWLIEDTVQTNDWSDAPASGWLSASNPSINVNTNIGGGAQNPGIILEGGTIRNPTITIVKDSTGAMFDGININGDAVNITVEGTHTAKPGEGVITMSDYAPGDAGKGAVGIRIDTSGCTVRGVRVIGDAQNGSPFYNISAYNDGADCVVEDCVADSIVVNSIDQLGSNGNITNAEYEALP